MTWLDTPWERCGQILIILIHALPTRVMAEGSPLARCSPSSFLLTHRRAQTKLLTLKTHCSGRRISLRISGSLPPARSRQSTCCKWTLPCVTHVPMLPDLQAGYLGHLFTTAS